MNKVSIKKSTILIIIVAILFISIGIKNGEFYDVYQKARLICLECIGIG